MNRPKSAPILRNVDNWEDFNDPSTVQQISEKVEEANTENFFSRKKKKGLLLWGLIMVFIIFVALKALLNISFVDFFRNLSASSSVSYFVATIILGLSTFFLCEVVVRVYIIKLKLGHRLKNVTKFQWFNFAVVSFLIQSITPFSIGSEPYNIGGLTKRGVPVRDATAATAVSSICGFISQFLVTGPSFIYLTINHWEKISSFNIPTCYGFVLIGLFVDFFVFVFIFVISYVSKAHYFISKLVNDVKRYFGMQYLTRDELFQKYLQNSTFKKVYVRYLWDISTLKVIAVYFVSNVWVYLIFALSHRLFFSNVFGQSYGNESTSTANSYHIINVATTANNFLPLPSAEGSLQVVLQQMMKEMLRIGTAGNTTLEANTMSQLNDCTIFLWRFFCKYLGLLVSLVFIFLFGFNMKTEYSNKQEDSLKRFKRHSKGGQTVHALTF